MTIPQPEPPPKPEVPDPESKTSPQTVDPEVAKKEREDGTELGAEREPA
jgi:hypothetical protein